MLSAEQLLAWAAFLGTAPFLSMMDKDSLYWLRLWPGHLHAEQVILQGTCKYYALPEGARGRISKDLLNVLSLICQ